MVFVGSIFIVFCNQNGFLSFFGGSRLGRTGLVYGASLSNRFGLRGRSRRTDLVYAAFPSNRFGVRRGLAEQIWSPCSICSCLVVFGSTRSYLVIFGSIEYYLVVFGNLW